MSNQNILNSWQANAKTWIETVENNEIESRVLVTNHAIIKVVIKYAVHNIFDVGCGEGWLSRKLVHLGYKVTGADAIDELITKAKSFNIGKFVTANYQEIANGIDLEAKPFDTIIINFALLDKENTEKLIPALKNYLVPNGNLIIQTLNPVIVNGHEEYKDGWRPGSWAGMAREFTMPYDWYFRTLESWQNLLISSGFTIIEMIEPINPKTNLKASLILVATV